MVELTNTLFVNSTNITTNIEAAVLSNTMHHLSFSTLDNSILLYTQGAFLISQKYMYICCKVLNVKQVIIEMFANNSAQDNFEAKRTLEEVLLLSCALLSSSKYLSAEVNALISPLIGYTS